MVRRKRKINRNRVVHNFQTAKDTAILFDATDPQTFRHIRDFSKYLEKQRIRTGLLGYVNSDEVPSDMVLWENCHVMCKKDLDFLFRPTDESVIQFMERDYDILFDLSMNDFFPLTFATVLSRAKFKVGRYKESLNDTDVMIDIKKEPTVDFLIEQIKNYVSILNNPESVRTLLPG